MHSCAIRGRCSEDIEFETDTHRKIESMLVRQGEWNMKKGNTHFDVKPALIAGISHVVGVKSFTFISTWDRNNVFEKYQSCLVVVVDCFGRVANSFQQITDMERRDAYGVVLLFDI